MGSEPDVMYYLIVSVMPASMCRIVMDRFPLSDGQSFGALVVDHDTGEDSTIGKIVYQLGVGVNCLTLAQLAALDENPFVVDHEVTTATAIRNHPARKVCEVNK